MKRIKRILKYIAYSLLSIIVLFSMYIIVMTKVFKQEYVNIFGYTYFIVATGSMSGTIEVNDIIIVKINDDFKEKDIITYNNKGSFITHRVEKIKDDKVITKGDVNNLEDDPVLKKDIIGRVVFVVSFSALLKITAVLLLLTIILIVINFEKVFKKYILKDKKTRKQTKTPLEYTQVITIDKDRKIPLLDRPNDGIEYLELDDEKEYLNLVLKILKLKNKKLKLTTRGSLKLKYVYELAYTTLIDSEEVKDLVKNIPFEELYDYDFDEICFTKNIQDKLYEMPIYIYYKLLAYTLLYDENEYFDAIFKILKYRILIDRNNKFINNYKRMEEVLVLVEKIVTNIGCIEEFELKEIREKVKTNKEIKEITLIG